MLIMSRMVLWRMPRSEKGGCKRAARSVLPDGGPPWTADRFLYAHRFGVGDRTAQAQADILVKAVRRAAGNPVDFEAVADKVLFDTKDNAADLLTKALASDAYHLHRRRGLNIQSTSIIHGYGRP